MKVPGPFEGAGRAPTLTIPHRSKGAPMRVEMTTQISGTRNGEEWPAPGAVLDLPAHEAADLILAGYAKEAADAPTPDPAPVPVVEEDGDEPSPAEDGDGAAEAESVAPVKPTRARKSTRKG